MTANPTAIPEPAVARAEALGHAVEWDPPWGMTAARRWTCTRCSATVLDYSGNIYGSAVTSTCADYAVELAELAELLRGAR